jgi:hypothetical protein
MAKTITWKDNDERTCVLTIDDGQESVTTLDAGAEPFVTSIDDTDDLFQPIRTSSGNIGVSIDSVDDIVSLVGRTPITTPVTLEVDGAVRWKGFLACESFSQEWDRGPLDVSLPVMSGLEVLNGIHYPYDSISDLGYINFAQFLVNMNTALGGIYGAFFFPNISDPATTLTYKFRLSNYATPDDKNTTYEMATYYDILEDICKLFGWQAVEVGAYLIFMAADVKSLVGGSNFKGYDPTSLQNLANGQTAIPLSPSFGRVIPEFYGVDHRRSFVAGKNSVKVVGELNEESEEIWSMDVVEQCSYKGHDAAAKIREYYQIKKFSVYTKNGNAIGNIEAINSLSSRTDENGYNIKFENYKNETDAYGGSVAYESFYKYNTDNVITEGSEDYVARLILRGVDASMYEGIILRTNYLFTPSQNNNVFKIEGDVLKATNPEDVFDKANGDVFVRAQFRVGNYYFDGDRNWSTSPTSTFLYVKDGKIEGLGHEVTRGYEATTYIPCPSISGQVELILYATTSTSYAQGEGYFALENLKISKMTFANRKAPYIEDKEIRSDVNEDKVELNNGFTDAWSQTCGLTIAREPVPDSDGVVLKSDLTMPDSLYSNKYPENALCDRVSAYVSKARMVLYAIVKGEGQMLSPLKYYAMQSGGRTWICMCQSVNWKNNEVTAGFFEPSFIT